MTDINYFTRGEGDTNILLVHGWASSANMWDNILNNFEHIGRFWAFDFPGFGDTPMPETPPSINDHLHTLITFIEEHNIQPQVIIAHSMGGLITLKMAHLRPDLAQQLVLICPVVTGKFGLQGVASQFLRNTVGTFALRQTEQFWQYIQKEYLLETVLRPWHINPYLAKRVREDFVRVNPRAGIEALISMTQEDMMPYLSEIQHPTLVNVGEQDLTVPPSEGQTAALYMPHAELHTYSKSRHHPHDEETDKFVPVLRQFLKRYNLS